MGIGRYTASLRWADWVLIGVTILLVCVGLAALFSVTLNVEQPRVEKFYRQLASFGIGLIALIVGMVVDFRALRSFGWALYGFGLMTLTAVLVVGTTLRGTTGWFSFFGSTFQPVELMKVLLVIVLARYFADHDDEGASWSVVLRSGLVAGFPVALVMLQPDLGSAFLLFVLWLGLLLVRRLPLRRLAILGVAFAVVLAGSWFLLRGYQRERLLTFIDPGRDPLRSGYNIRQSIVAIGSGRLFGRGLGLGTQSQLNFLPTQDTDFIFAVIAEELGFVGTSILLALFVTFLLRFVRGLDAVRDPYGRMLLAGYLILFTTQIFVNIGGNLGLLPLTGTPLPFLSYGGSALISSLFAVGVSLGVIARASGRTS